MSVQIYKNGIVDAGGTLIRNNILLNSDFHQTHQQTTGWDTSKNGSTLASNWGGYNGGVTNASTCYHAHLVQFDGIWCYKYVRETETWLGVAQGNLQTRGVTPNTTYTFSVSQYRTTGANNYITAGLYFRKVGSTTYSFYSGCPRIVADTTTFNRWVRGVFTFSTPEDLDVSYNVSFYIYGYSGGTGTIYMCDPKLEIDSDATSPCLNSTEGYVESDHGFIETTPSHVSVYSNYIEANEFIEY